MKNFANFNVILLKLWAKLNLELCEKSFANFNAILFYQKHVIMAESYKF